MVAVGLFKEIRACRLCHRCELTHVISLGEQALTGGFPKPGEPDPPIAPLSVVRCTECGLVQLRHSVQPEEMYSHSYGYRSSVNQTMRDHLSGIARSVSEIVPLSAGDVVLDIGCNDGTLLKHYAVDGLVRVGIDPLVDMFRCEIPDDVIARAGFFDATLFFSATSGRKAKAVTSISMFYDLEDPSGFAADIAATLDRDGIWIIEQSYLPLMLKENAFDTICHEHLEYYALAQIERITRNNSLRIFEVTLNQINGGSFRIHVCHQDAPYLTNSVNVDKLHRMEKDMAMDTAEPYRAFRDRVSDIREKIRSVVVGEAANGKKIYVYGASTKGNVLLQYCGLDHTVIKGAAERNPFKWGARTPATGIPIVSEEEARADAPDYFLVLPWHFRDEILAREPDFRANGGRFIFPLPTVEIV